MKLSAQFGGDKLVSANQSMTHWTSKVLQGRMEEPVSLLPGDTRRGGVGVLSLLGSPPVFSHGVGPGIWQPVQAGNVVRVAFFLWLNIILNQDSFFTQQDFELCFYCCSFTRFLRFICTGTFYDSRVYEGVLGQRKSMSLSGEEQKSDTLTTNVMSGNTHMLPEHWGLLWATSDMHAVGTHQYHTCSKPWITASYILY